MTFEERMEELQQQIRDGRNRQRELMAEQERLVDENIGQPCRFCGEGTVKVNNFSNGWVMGCDECYASTPASETFAEALAYWNAMLKVHEELNHGSAI